MDIVGKKRDDCDDYIHVLQFVNKDEFEEAMAMLQVVSDRMFPVGSDLEWDRNVMASIIDKLQERVVFETNGVENNVTSFLHEDEIDNLANELFYLTYVSENIPKFIEIADQWKFLFDIQNRQMQRLEAVNAELSSVCQAQQAILEHLRKRHPFVQNEIDRLFAEFEGSHGLPS